MNLNQVPLTACRHLTRGTRQHPDVTGTKSIRELRLPTWEAGTHSTEQSLNATLKEVTVTPYATHLVHLDGRLLIWLLPVQPNYSPEGVLRERLKGAALSTRYRSHDGKQATIAASNWRRSSTQHTQRPDDRLSR